MCCSVQHRTVRELPHWLQKSDSKPQEVLKQYVTSQSFVPKPKGKSEMNLGGDQRAEKSFYVSGLYYITKEAFSLLLKIK